MIFWATLSEDGKHITGYFTAAQALGPDVPLEEMTTADPRYAEYFAALPPMYQDWFPKPGA